MIRRLILMLMMLINIDIASASDGIFQIRNKTLVGMQIGWGPSFDCEGGVRDYQLELHNGTVGFGYSKNGRYVERGGTNPTIFTWTFGYDFPVFTRSRFQMSLNPSLGWEVRNYFSDVHHTKMAPYYRETSGPKFGCAANFDIEIFERMCPRVSVRYLNKTLAFGIGIVFRHNYGYEPPVKKKK